MKKLLVILLLISRISYAQDGSDIRYLKTEDIDSTFTGRIVQFDFYNRSFGQINVDTVIIVIGRKPTAFVERRNDNGYENWFDEQKLESVREVNGQLLVIPEFELRRIDSNQFLVNMRIEYYNSENMSLEKTLYFEHWFDREDIEEVLIDEKISN